MSVNFDEQWVPEPELRETPPRRTGPSEFPDHNRPKSTLFVAVAAVVLVAGLVVFILGASKGVNMQIFAGVFAVLAGTAGTVFFPYMARRHDGRVERLVGFGVPAMARLLNAENISVDNIYGRRVTFQITHPSSGELLHRTTNADDRALPKRIPANVTALVDPETGYFDLYCALPIKAVTKMVAQTAKPAGTEAPAPAEPTEMGTLAAQPNPERIVRKPREEDDDDLVPKRESYE